MLHLLSWRECSRWPTARCPGAAALALWLATLAASAAQPANQEPRIVSLSPALSRTLVALGLGERIVGRTPWCASLDARIPVVGDLHRIDYERLLRVRPTHVLVQTPAAGLDPELHRLARREGWTLGAWRRLDRLDDIRALVAGLPGLLFGDAPPEAVKTHARALLAALDAAEASRPCEGDPGPLLLATGADPLLAFGARTYLDDLLRAWGLRNAVAAEGWVPLALEAAVRRAPAWVVWVTDRGDPAPAALRAAFPDRVRVLDHPDALLPAATVAEIARALSRVLAAAPGCRASAP
jgi:ABC-type hemin transport system substrate-binding protein